MLVPRASTGIALALVCLCILGVMPVIASARPGDVTALGFAFWLSIWQLVFALPVAGVEHLARRQAGRGIGGYAEPHAGRSAEQSTAQGDGAPLPHRDESHHDETHLDASRSDGGHPDENHHDGNHPDGRRRARTLVVAVATGMMFGLSTYLYVLAIEKAGAVSAAIAIQAYPLFAILLETVFLKRRKTAVELMLTTALIGALIFLGTEGTWRIAGISGWFLVALSVPLLWSIAHVVIKEELANTPITPAQITFARVAISAVFLGILVAALAPQELFAPLWRADYQAFALAMGFVYYVELMFWFYAVRHIDVSLASSLTTPWPALTMVLAAVFLGTQIHGYQVAAFVVVAGCIYGLIIAQLRKQRTHQVN